MWYELELASRWNTYCLVLSVCTIMCTCMHTCVYTSKIKGSVHMLRLGECTQSYGCTYLTTCMSTGTWTILWVLHVGVLRYLSILCCQLLISLSYTLHIRTSYTCILHTYMYLCFIGSLSDSYHISPAWSRAGWLQLFHWWGNHGKRVIPNVYMHM